jgi:hypothetical protein
VQFSNLSLGPRRRRVGGGRHRVLRWSLTLGGLGLLLVAVLAAAHLLDARREVSLARSALDRSREAILFRDVDRAGQALDAADGHLQAAGRAARSLPLSLLGPIPLLGSPVRALSDGSRAGREAVAAGRHLAGVAEALPAAGAPVVDGHDLSAVHTAAVASDTAFRRAQGHLATARGLLEGPAGARLPQVARPAKAFLAELDHASAQLVTTERALRLTGELTAPETDVRLLVLAQDSMELRATGGLIGSYGVLHIAHGTARLEEYDDVGVLPNPKPPMDPPDELGRNLARPWNLVNANWWPDFPTSARTAAEMFRRGGRGEVEGVLAMTEATMARLVGVLGPVQLPGYAEPITEEGFAERILYEIELKRPLDEPRKKYLIELADEMFHRLLALPADKVPAVMKALAASAGAGELQLWFGNEERQALLAGSAVDGALPAPGGDFLLLAESNMTASKANAGLTRHLQYRVGAGGDGRLRATLRIRYRNDGPKSEINPYYNGLVRVYVPKGSDLVGDHGQIVDASDGPYSVLMSQVYVPPDGGERVITFEYLLPRSVAPGGKYRLTWLRQPGTPRDSYAAVVGGRTFRSTDGERRLTVHAQIPKRREQT